MSHRLPALAVAVLALLALGAVAPAAASGGTTYYVAITGSDSNAGTSGSPFRNVQKCATVMVAGDTCQIADGTYRETVTPAASGTAANRITYVAAPGAQVVIDGSNAVTGWSVVSAGDFSTLAAADATLTGSPFATAVATGQVYKATLSIAGGLPGNQVFVDGGMQVEAAWPAPGNNPAEPVLASAASGTATSLSDPLLTQPAGWWVGARLTSHNWFVSETGIVTSSAVGSVTASALPNCVGLSPNQHNLYSLSGKLALLGSKGMWHYQGGKLYLWTIDGSSPASHLVEAKQRNVAIDLGSRNFISVLGIGVRGATVQLGATSHDNVIDGMTARYVSAYSDLVVDPNKVTPSDGCDVLTAGETTSGILIRGSNNTLRNSTIDWSAGNGVMVAGTGNTITNNVITNTDYLGSYAAGINMLGSNHVVTHNTVTGVGRSNINIDNKVAGTTAAGHKIAYNDLSDYGKLVNDVGAIYVCCGVNLATSIIDHNLLHDAAPVAADGPAPGVYLDLATYNATVANNVAWNRTTYGVVLINPGSGTASGNKIINNTSGTDPVSVSLFGGTHTTTEVTNNIGKVDPAAGATLTSNLSSTTNPQFTNPGALDFTVGSGSPARSAGAVRAPWTNGSTDAVPTIGAYPYGAVKWVGGVRTSATVVQAESYSGSSGVSTHAAGTGSVLGSFDGGDWVKYSSVNFGNGRDTLTASFGVDPAYSGGRYEIRRDTISGPLLATAIGSSTGGFDNFRPQLTPIVPTSGTHDVFVIALGSAPGVGNFDYLSFGRAPVQLEAEKADTATGTTIAAGGTGSVVGSFDGGDSLKFLSVNFGAGRTSFAASVAVDPTYAGQTFQIRLDSPTGTSIGTVTGASTGGWDKYATQTQAITSTTGVHDVYLVAAGGAGVANLDWAAFE